MDIIKRTHTLKYTHTPTHTHTQVTLLSIKVFAAKLTMT